MDLEHNQNEFGSKAQLNNKPISKWNHCSTVWYKDQQIKVPPHNLTRKPTHRAESMTLHGLKHLSTWNDKPLNMEWNTAQGKEK